MAAYIAWVQWGTGFITAHNQDRLRGEIDQRIAEARSGSAPDAVTTAVPGHAVAIIQIPSIHLDMVVVEGTARHDLEKGPGHYSDTAYPWQPTGRVGIAGHRTTYLHPFWNLDELRPGQGIRLVTEFGSFDYVVTGSRVVLPSDVWVLHRTEAPTLVLTACTPRFSASHRLAVFARRVAGSSGGPHVRVTGPVKGTADVGPGDDVARSLLVTLALSFATGGLYLVVGAVRRRRHSG